MKVIGWAMYAAWAAGVLWLYGKNRDAAYFFGAFTLTVIILEARAGARRARLRNR